MEPEMWCALYGRHFYRWDGTYMGYRGFRCSMCDFKPAWADYKEFVK